MALRWDFKEDLIGWYEDTETKESAQTFVHGVRLYDGNALMIAVWESENNYFMHSFFTDEEHAKNCLKDDPIYPKDAVFHLYRGKRSAKKLANILTKYQISVIWEDKNNVN